MYFIITFSIIPHIEVPLSFHPLGIIERTKPKTRRKLTLIFELVFQFAKQARKVINRRKTHKCEGVRDYGWSGLFEAKRHLQ